MRNYIGRDELEVINYEVVILSLDAHVLCYCTMRFVYIVRIQMKVAQKSLDLYGAPGLFDHT